MHNAAVYRHLLSKGKSTYTEMTLRFPIATMQQYWWLYSIHKPAHQTPDKEINDDTELI